MSYLQRHRHGRPPGDECDRSTLLEPWPAPFRIAERQQLSPEARRGRAPLPLGYDAGISQALLKQPGQLFGRPRRRHVAVSRQVARAAFASVVGGSKKALRLAGRAVYAIDTVAEYVALVNNATGTVSAGAVIVTPEAATWALNVQLKEGVGTGPDDKITTIVANYATNFTQYTAARIGVDDDLCTTMHSDDSTGGADPPIKGGAGSRYVFYGINFTSAINQGVRSPGALVDFGDRSTSGTYSNGVATAGDTASITLAASESTDWTDARIVVHDNGTIIDRRVVASYNTDTKVAVPNTPFSQATSGLNYHVNLACHHAADLGAGGFYHCLFNGPDCGKNNGVVVSNGTGLIPHTQDCVIEDCDFTMHFAGAEHKCIAGNNGYGPITIRNCRLRNATIGLLYASAFGLLEEDPYSAPGMLIEYTLFDNDPNHADAGSLKGHLELKSAEGVEIRYCVFKNSWVGIHQGQAINISWVAGGESWTNSGHRIHDCFIYDTESGIILGTSGGEIVPETTDVRIWNVLSLVGFDVRDDSVSDRQAHTLNDCEDLWFYHNTTIGNQANRLLTGTWCNVGNGGTTPGLVIRDNASSQVGNGSIAHTVYASGFAGEAALDASAGAGLWTFLNNFFPFSPGESMGNYPTIRAWNYDETTQSAFEAGLDLDTYVVSDGTKVSNTDGLVAGIASTLWARVAGVEAGVPTDLQSTRRIQLAGGKLLLGPTGHPQVLTG